MQRFRDRGELFHKCAAFRRALNAGKYTGITHDVIVGEKGIWSAAPGVENMPDGILNMAVPRATALSIVGRHQICCHLVSGHSVAAVNCFIVRSIATPESRGPMRETAQPGMSEVPADCRPGKIG